MKILAIRGENIASLVGPFAVEFASAPLAEQGLIAITGKTGSGKSTLLDCLCLALYEQVPRFEDQSRTVEIGEETDDKLKANDVRNLVSRGQANAMAEVEFLSHDDKRYLVRWQVRRARNQASGRWQSSSRELIDLTSQEPFSANKREFQQYVTDLIGLDYAQFRRSVMLAQGDFAAFLKAPEDQRSALLEQMTGTALYSQISAQVYQTYKEHAQELDKLKSQIEQTQLLDDSALSELDQQLAGAAARQTQLRQLEQANRVLNTQLLDLDSANEKVKKVQTRFAKLQEQEPQINTQRSQLEMLNKVQPLRHTFERKSQLKASLGQTNEQLQQVALEYEQQLQSLDSLKLKQADAQNRLKEFHTQQSSRQSELEHARQIEQRQKLFEDDLLNLQQDVQQKQSTVKKAGIELSTLNTQHQELTKALAQTQHWLDEQAIQGQWLKRQGEIVHLLQDYQRLEQQLLVERQRQQQVTELSEHIAQMRSHKNELEQALKRLVSQQDSLGPTVGKEQQLQEQYKAVQNELAKAQQRQNLLYQAGQLSQQWQNSQDQLQHYQNVLNDLLKGQSDCQSKLQLIAPRIDELSQQYHSARQVVELSDYRRELVTDEPCPLCGSHHHPYVEQQTPGESIVRQLYSRLEALHAEQSQLRAQLLNAQEQIPQLKEQLSLISYHQQQLQADLTERLAALELDDSTTIEQLRQEYQSSGEKIAALSAQVQQLEIQAQQMVHSLKRLEQLNHEIEQLRTHDQQFDTKLQLALQQQKQLNDDLNHSADSNVLLQYKNIHQQLDELFSIIDWQDILAHSGCSGFSAWLEEQINYYQSILSQFETMQSQLMALNHQIEQQSLQLKNAEQNLSESQARIDENHHQLNELKQTSKSLLNGLSVSQWLEQVREQQQSFEAALNELNQQLEMFNQRATELLTRREYLSEQLEKLRSELALCQTQWQSKLDEYLLNQDKAEQLLALSSAEIDAIRLQIQQYEQQLIALTTEQEQAKQFASVQLNAVQSAQQTIEGQLRQLDINGGIQALSEQLSAQDELIYQLRSRLDQNAKAQQQFKALNDTYQSRLQTCAVWEELNQLIGSANGAKFRIFAQQLTLDKLLYEANHQLLELAPRYQLQRIPGQSLALQIIDQDMADEVRSLASLSGGETFLVSLALALALSAVSSRNLKIQSLFIDEGFGSLDPQSLDVVLSCLDKLQAKGRQVTAISHVQTMVERISAKICLHSLGGGHSRLQTLVN
ncbi:AAA family ATPase [Celerinatantimonas sp. MCCC 1A17872]|uniref:AAA family ATPase n=1 Tax=Celerinatantimonas sp. MCCC 1A17872 TaxID=3177514 RepID=UPI0038C40592